jgi:hypothetical protein
MCQNEILIARLILSERKLKIYKKIKTLLFM